jgi:simple sugar transport system ATP-binding protein
MTVVSVPLVKETPTMAAAPVLTLRNISKAFGDVHALSDISLEVRQREVHCLLGENGAGKSTLCNIVFGAYAPTAGAMTLAGESYTPHSPKDAIQAGVAMVHQHFSLIPTLTVLENLQLGRGLGVLTPRRYQERVEEIRERYGFSFALNVPAHALTVGQLQQVEITKSLLYSPRLLILDEPTAVLTPQAIDGFLDSVRRIVLDGIGLVLVTHKLAEIARIADRVSVLRGGCLVDAGEPAHRSVQSFVASMIGRELSGESAAALRQDSDQVARHIPDVVMVDGLGYTDPQGRKILDNVTMIVGKGEIVGIAGVEGNGQSEFAQILTGALAPSEGRVFLGDTSIGGLGAARVRQAGMAVIPEDRHRDGCIVELSLAENLTLGAWRKFARKGVLRRRDLEADAQAMMQSYDIRAAGPAQRFGRLSGGNQQKAVLARELGIAPLRAVLAVHPTRGLDVGAVDFVYRQLGKIAEQGGAILVISSELDEMMAQCSAIVVFFKGRIAGILKRHEFDKSRIGTLMAGASV